MPIPADFIEYFNAKLLIEYQLSLYVRRCLVDRQEADLMQMHLFRLQDQLRKKSAARCECAANISVRESASNVGNG